MVRNRWLLDNFLSISQSYCRNVFSKIDMEAKIRFEAYFRAIPKCLCQKESPQLQQFGIFIFRLAIRHKFEVLKVWYFSWTVELFIGNLMSALISIWYIFSKVGIFAKGGWKKCAKLLNKTVWKKSLWNFWLLKIIAKLVEKTLEIHYIDLKTNFLAQHQVQIFFRKYVVSHFFDNSIMAMHPVIFLGNSES